jgi:hypothetical protein
MTRAMRRRGLFVILIALLALPPGPVAAAPPWGADPQATVLSELVVQARSPGPAWWRVTKGESTVWILGIPAGMPRSTRWDQATLLRRLSGAKSLILPATLTAGLGDLFQALSLRSRLRSREAVQDTLPPDLKARYLAAAAQLGRPPSAYDHWKPAVAGLFMLADYRRRYGFDEFQPLNAVRAAASRVGVRAKPAAAYRAVPFLKAVAGDLSDEVNRACLADALAEIEAGGGRSRAAAEGWAHGDVAVALTAERGFDLCLATFPEFNDQVRRMMSDEATAIMQALQTPGVSVAAVELRSLVAREGVLARLKAAGYEIRTPASE